MLLDCGEYTRCHLCTQPRPFGRTRTTMVASTATLPTPAGTIETLGGCPLSALAAYLGSTTFHVHPIVRRTMLRTIEAIIEPDGRVRLLEAVELSGTRRALVTLLEEAAEEAAGEVTALLSERHSPRTGTVRKRTPRGRTCSRKRSSRPVSVLGSLAVQAASGGGAGGGRPGRLPALSGDQQPVRGPTGGLNYRRRTSPKARCSAPAMRVRASCSRRAAS